MALEPISETEIARIVNCLRGSSSSGPDRVPTKVVKFILPVIVCALTRLVNLSFENGVFPSALKRARVNNLFLKLDQEMILQIIVPYLFYQCLVKFLKKLCFLDFLIFLILNTFFMIFSLVLGQNIQLSMHVQLS